MKKWKQISACCLAAVLAAAAPTGTAWAGSPEFARSAEEWAKLRDNVMEYDELAGLIHEYNVTVQNNQRDYNEKKNKQAMKSHRITGMRPTRSGAACLGTTVPRLSCRTAWRKRRL